MEKTTETILGAPPEAWVALTGVLLGAIISIIGVWLTNNSNTNRLKVQLEFEKNHVLRSFEGKGLKSCISSLSIG